MKQKMFFSHMAGIMGLGVRGGGGGGGDFQVQLFLLPYAIA